MTPSIPRSTFAFFGHAFMTTGKVYLILFLIVGWVVGGLTEIDGIWAPVWIAGTFLAVLMTASGNASSCRRTVDATIEFLQSHLDKVDYWSITRGSGVAIDIRAGKLAIEGTYNRKRVKKVLSFGQIRDVQAIAKDKNLVKAIGNASSGTKADIARHNYEETIRAAQGTGLVFELDDIDTPSIFVKLQFSRAERWLLLLEKVVKGSLESTATPTEIN